MPIPKEIIDLCLDFFFHCMDIFCAELSGPHMVISSDGHKATKSDHNNDDSRFGASTFGQHEIDSLNNEYIYIWKFKIIQMTKTVVIGITCAYIDTEIGRTTWHPGLIGYSYSYNGFDGTITKTERRIRRETCITRFHYGPIWNTGDIIEMIFDAQKGWLWYRINGERVRGRSDSLLSNDSQIAFTDIETGKSIKYRMEVMMKGSRDCISILSFSIKKPYEMYA